MSFLQNRDLKKFTFDIKGSQYSRYVKTKYSRIKDPALVTEETSMDESFKSDYNPESSVESAPKVKAPIGPNTFAY